MVGNDPVILEPERDGLACADQAAQGAALWPRPSGDFFRSLLHVFQHRHRTCPVSVVVRSGRARVHRPALAQMVHELRKCETVQHALRRHPALLRHLDAPVRQVDFAGRVCIRVDAHHAPKLQRALMPAPIKVKTPGISVDLHGHAMRGAGFQESSRYPPRSRAAATAGGPSYGQGWWCRDLLLRAGCARSGFPGQV